MTPRRVCARAALAAMACYAAFCLLFLAGPGHGDPAWFIQLGSKRIPIVLARQLLGQRVVVPHTDGHDGRFFWIQARDPLLLHPKLDAANLDRPGYRAQRIGYPLLAAPWRVFGEYGAVWALVLTNLAIVGLGTWWTTALALDVGALPRAGLAFALNPAVVVAVLFDTSDALAIAAVVGSLLFLRRGRFGLAVALAAVGALAKEPMLLAVGAVAVLAPGLRLVRRALLVGVPAAVAGLWALYERWRLGWPPSQIEEFTRPLSGYLDAYRRGWRPVGNWGDALVAVGVLALAVVLVAVWWRRRSTLMAAALPFALLVPFLSSQVLDLADNSMRALGPALTLLAIEAYRRRPAAIATPAPPAP
jgi:hypothetical protein